MTRAEEQLFHHFVRTGDAAALARVFDALAPELRQRARLWSADPTEADDLLQATCVAAIENAARYDPKQPLRPWWIGILANQARAARRARRRVPDPQRLCECTGDRQDETLRAAQRRELFEQVEGALSRLPARARPVVQLRLEQGLSTAEIADALQRPRGTVRSQLARGLEALRRLLPAGVVGGCRRAPTAPHEQAALPHLAHGRDLGAPAHHTLLHGWMLMKKAVVLSAVVVALALGIGLTSRELFSASHDAVAVEPDTGLVEQVQPGQPATGAGAGAQAPTQRAPVRDTATVLAARAGARGAGASLEVAVQWERGGAAAGEVVFVRTGRDTVSPAVEHVAQTGEDGRAVFAALEPGPITVGVLRGTRRELVVEGGERARVQLAIPVGIAVEGRVVDAAGRPVPAASVFVSRRFRWDVTHAVTESDSEGRFRLRAVSPDQNIGVRHADFEPSYLQSARGEPGSECTLHFTLAGRGATLEGLVVDEGGAPLDGVEVLVGSETWRERTLSDGRSAGMAAPVRVASDEQGRFRCTGLTPGRVSVQARARGFGPSVQFVDLHADIGARAQLCLTPEASVVGTVVSAAGLPLAGVRVELAEASSFRAAHCNSDEQGIFVLRGLAAGELQLLASHPRHGRARTSVTLAAGEQLRWEPRLQADPRVFGQVLDAAGAPRSDWGVVVKDGGRWLARVETDVEGWFAFPELTEGSYTVHVKAPGDWRLPPVHVERDVRPGLDALVLRVSGGALERVSIHGSIVGPAHLPLAEAQASLWQQEDGVWRTVEVDARSGEFRFDDVPAGTCFVSASGADYPRVSLPGIRLGPGDERDVGAIVLPEPGRIEGSIVAGDEDWLPHAVLELRRDGQLLEETIERVGRRVRSAPLVPGEYEVVLRGDGICTQRAIVQVVAGGDARVELTLAQAGVRELSISWPDGAQAPRWISCSALAASGRTVWSQRVRASGTSALVRVSAEPGTYRFRAFAAGLAVITPLDVPAPGIVPARQHIALEPER